MERAADSRDREPTRVPLGRSRLATGLGLALAFLAFETLVFWLLAPLHARGVGQPIIGFLNGLDHLLQLPGLLLALFLGFHPGYHLAKSSWFLITLLNLPLYFWAGFRLRKTDGNKQGAAEEARKVALSETSEKADTRRAKTWSRRDLLGAGIRLSAGGALAGLGYALVIEPRWCVITERRIPLRDLPPELEGLRAVQLSDIHHGPWLALDYVRQIVDRTNALAPDVILLTGDYVHRSPAYIEPVVQELARLRAKIGTVAVLGNHDWYEGAERIRRGLRQASIPVIDNDRRIITPERRLVADAREGLCLAGVGDLWEDRQDYRRALAGLPSDMPRVLLAHNPDVAEEPELVRGGFRVDLQVSGHTHGGQIRLPFIGAAVTPSRFGQKYAQGLVQGPRCPVFISTGIGVSMLPTRMGVPPEIAVLEFVSRVG